MGAHCTKTAKLLYNERRVSVASHATATRAEYRASLPARLTFEVAEWRALCDCDHSNCKGNYEDFIRID